MTASEPRSGPSGSGGSVDDELVDPTEPVIVGEYTWETFLTEYDLTDGQSLTRTSHTPEDSGGLLDRIRGGNAGNGRSRIDWSRLGVDPEQFLGFHPHETDERLARASGRARTVQQLFNESVTATPVVKDEYGWEAFKHEYYYDPDGTPPRDSSGEIVPFDPTEYLGFDPVEIDDVLGDHADTTEKLTDLVEERTVNVRPELDEDEFFSTTDGHTTMVNRYDLEKSVPMAKKRHFEEVERYWVNEPYAFVVIFHSTKENEEKYYLIDPYLNELEEEVRTYLAGKLRTAIRYSDEDFALQNDAQERSEVIEREVQRLLARYDIYEDDDDEGVVEQLGTLLNGDGPVESDEEETQLDGIEARPEPVVLAENPDTLTEYQSEKLLYRLKRDFLGYERIDGIKHDIQVEDISCDGYNSPVFVYHTEYEQIITNIEHGETQLDNFVIKLAQRSGKGISKRRPQVDATLPDGSRAQLTLGREVSDHGTNYTIRQFNDVPFTPVDLINWNTFSLDEMAYLWLCIESEKSVLFGGGTASGKTTSLNAVSLFIPSNSKIVSIEDTREVELPQRNWVASVTRPSFTEDDGGDIDEFDLLEAALRQRPEYIVMGEVRGEEGRTLFQVMSTGHTTLTTFHADSVDEVLKRFTTDPINVSKTMFTALDIVSIQTQTRVGGRKVRRNRVLTDVNYYETENDEINVQDVYQWQAETDEFLQLSESNVLDDIIFDRGWDRERLELELFKRQTVLAYLIDRGLNEYAEVAATLQAFINDPDTILTLMARDELGESLKDLREMESVLIDVNPEKEALVPRPDPTDAKRETAKSVLEKAQQRLFDEYEHRQPSALVDALPDLEESKALAAATPNEDESATTSVESHDEDESATTSVESSDADELDWAGGSGREDDSHGTVESTGEDDSDTTTEATETDGTVESSNQDTDDFGDTDSGT